MLSQNSLQSSNPVLASDDAFQQYYGSESAARADVTTLQGVVNKTGILVLIAVVCGAAGYAIGDILGFGIVTISAIISFIVTLGIFFKLRGNPAHAVYLAPVYAVVQGFFLGALTGMLEGMLAHMGYTAVGGLAFQAFVITISVMLAMLGLYYARILQPTRKFVAVVSVLTVGVMITYVIAFALSFFGMELPFYSITHGAREGGNAMLIGIGINLLILGIASLYLIIDFGLVEQKIKSGAPKVMEWYCAFALIVTLAWIYFEAVKLAARMAILFGNRE